MTIPQPIIDAINEALENCPEDMKVDVKFSTVMFGAIPMLSCEINILPKELSE
tara:strand:- start:1920 stop:2078 length:159 start_codon:yes stop_codon:yes gene_type:complete